MYFRKQTPNSPRRGLTPRMLELSRRLNDIEFKEHSPLAASTQPKGSGSSADSPSSSASGPPAAVPPLPPLPPVATVLEEVAEEGTEERQQYKQLENKSRVSSNTYNIHANTSSSGGPAVRLRDRMKVPLSEPANLGGLDLVEPARVDTTYREDDETWEYRQRRQARESIGSNDGFSMGISLQRRTFSGGSQQQPSARTSSGGSSRSIAIPSFLAASALGASRPSSGEFDNGLPTLAECRKLVALTRRIHEDWAEVSNSMRELRVLIASNGGLPVNPLDYNSSKLRGIMWLAMLEVRDISAEGYRGALRRCPSVCASKINNDAFRTLAGDAEFRRCVTTESIVRVLNALLSAPDQSASDPPRYVQGMNTLLAPFLYVLGEGAAFHAFRQFLRNECPLYARPSLPGVHACVQLVDECLSFLDPRLYSHLKRHGAVAKIYAFPAAMTLSANVGPLRQVVRLWDFLLAFGVHLNVVCIVAQLLSMRELLVTTTSPMSFLRSWPPLRAESVIRRTRELYELIPDALKKRIKLHAHDPQLAEGLASAPQVPDPLLDGGQRARVTSGDYSSLKRDLSPNLNNGNGSNTSSRNSSNGSGRPRAKTFSGTAGPKRMRTGGNNGLGGLPKYGAMGLGIMPVNSSADAGGGRPRVLSGGRRPVRGMRLAAGSEAMWLLDRKLSAEFNDTRPDRPQWLDLNPTIEQ